LNFIDENDEVLVAVFFENPWPRFFSWAPAPAIG